VPLADLTAPAAALARRGVPVNRQQGYVFGLLAGLVGGTPEARAKYFVDGRPPRQGDLLRDPELADALDRLGADGAAPFYTGDLGAAVADWVGARGGALGWADLAAYEVVARAPVRLAYRGRDVFTNPPPNAGGILLAYALARLAAVPGGPPDSAALVDAMAAAHAVRTPAFLTGLGEPGFADTLLGSRLGSTTHISVLDTDGWAASVSCTNGEGSGVVVPGTGIHVNNMMGEEDLSPLGFFTHPPGRRLPSMMAPTVLRRDGATELVLGSAGSNRIRSALLQVIVNVVDRELPAQAAVDAPRLHLDGGTVYAEPGVDLAGVRAAGWPVSLFRERNLFFGGCQAVWRRGGALTGGGDPRRGGAVALA
jgi:gamma-glutamyltranspeptidase/glutathione hydrolase